MMTGNKPAENGSKIPRTASLDPTENVKALSEAANRRQDDLREASERFIEAKIASSAEIDAIRASHAKYMASAESRRVDEQAALRADFADKLATAEAKRIDAIRAVDVNAVAVASQRASDQATVLATQVAQSAEALRALVATTAATVAASLQQMSNALSTRLTTLEQGSYQALGKQSYSDPAFAELLTEVKSLRETGKQSAGKNEGISASWAVFLGIATVLVMAAGALGFSFSGHTPPTASQPQVIYLPSPQAVPPATVVAPTVPR